MKGTQKTATSIHKSMQLAQERESAIWSKLHKTICDPILRRIESIVMNTDGNTAALNKHLAERERYEDAQIRDMYCPSCDETIDGESWPHHVKDETCPNCDGQLEETP